MTELALALGIDVGGTKIASGLVDRDGAVQEAQVHLTAGPGEAAIEQLIDIARSYLTQRQVAHIGIVVPGGVDPATQTVISAPNLGWRDLPLAQRLLHKLGRDVHLENDANAAAWAEHRFAAGRGQETTILVTVGTGIGGGLVIRDQLFRGQHGLSGEIGHLPLIANGRPCPCGSSGCWEQYASGTALVAEGRRRDWKPSQFTGAEILTAAEAGDHTAIDIVDTVSGHLAHGLTILAATLDPSRVILGGGLGSDPRFVRRVNASLQQFKPTPQRFPFTARIAVLGVHAGLIGAADLARNPDATMLRPPGEVRSA